jgi:acetyl esterase/lipase
MARLNKACMVIMPLLAVLIISGCTLQNSGSADIPATPAPVAPATPEPLPQEQAPDAVNEPPAQEQAPDTVNEPPAQEQVPNAPDSTPFHPGQILGVQFLETVSVAEIDTLGQAFYPVAERPNPAFDVSIFRLNILSSNELGEPAEFQADIFIPQLAEAATLPVVGYAPGTTGIGNECAPSLETVLGRNWGSYRTYMLTLAGQGYIGVLPDGQNYADPERPLGYFISELVAYTLLDATRAVYNFLADPEVELKAEPLDAVFFGGYSSGGHAAFAAKDFAAAYAPELNIRGIISHGATTNVETLMHEAPIFSPYLIYVYRYYYGSETITPEQVFAPAILENFEELVPSLCVDEVYARYVSDPQVMYNEGFLAALRNNQVAAQYPLFGAVLSANSAGLFGGFDIPVVFFQGTGDYIVTPTAQERFAQDLCAQGQTVTYVELPVVEHVATRQHSFMAMLAWMQSTLAGETPENNCEDLGR